MADTLFDRSCRRTGVLPFGSFDQESLDDDCDLDADMCRCHLNFVPIDQIAGDEDQWRDWIDAGKHIIDEKQDVEPPMFSGNDWDHDAYLSKPFNEWLLPSASASPKGRFKRA